jgi:AbiV family abortive infection protein
MGLGLKRTDLRANAERKLQDAKILFSAGSFSNSYYLAGYTIELGLKACIAAQMSADTIPSKEILKKLLDHNFQNLVGVAGLATALREQQAKDVEFGANWAIAAEWSPDVRYESVSAAEVQLLVAAIENPESGVLTWIKNYW